MEKPILYYWPPCTTCQQVTRFAQEAGLALDARDVEQQAPYDELLALGGDANQIPYLYAEGQLIQGVSAINDYLGHTALYVAAHPAVHPAFDQFAATVAALRAPGGCPWDRAQTHESIAHNFIEETYEAVDCIEAGDAAHLREELGDVLLQVVLHSKIAEDAGEFSLDEVCAEVNDKIVRRHPHVFGEAVAGDANEVLDLWDKVKLAERAAGQEAPGAEAPAPAPAPSMLDSVPKSFPALMQCQKISRKAAAAGFEWDTIDDVHAQVESEMAELREAYAAAEKSANGKVVADGSAAAAAVEMEFGDVLFALVNVGRRMGVDAESALRASCSKFRRRWAAVEACAAAEGHDVSELSTARQNELWQQVKAAE